MRTTLVAVLSLGFITSLFAQQLHEATPPEELIRQYWATHAVTAEASGEHAHHHAMATAPAESAPLIVASDVAAAATKAFTITAHQFAFTINPSNFVVNQGDTVTLNITSSDVTHGFFLENYGIDTTMNNGQHRTFTFVANTAGSFSYFCTVSTCGTGHVGMFGTFIVQAAATPPSVSSFTPSSGPTSGGTVVAITGSNFQNGATVKFGDANAVSATVNGSTSISAMSPAHAAGDVTITVTNADGQSATAGTFTYTVPGPSISSITPATGTTAGGTPLTISGSNFVAGATVTIAGAPATITAVTSTTIVATTPVGPVNISTSTGVDVVVTNPDGRSATRSGGFTYTLAAPAIASLSPTASLPAGGTSIAIAGSGFTTALPVSVTFGGLAGTNVQVISPTLLTVTVPAHAAGAVDVVVTVGSAHATAANGFSYQAAGKRRRAVKPL